MSIRLSIGEFSRMTHLSVKALRHYHDVGVLVPAEIDRASGYRFYAVPQVSTAHLIRRLRDLDMPLDDVRVVLAADERVRNETIAAHLSRMEQRLAATQASVASLRALLESPHLPGSVEFRSVPPTRAIAIREHVRFDECEAWLPGAYEELANAGFAATGPAAATYDADFFEAELGEVVAFVPVHETGAVRGRVEVLELPAVDLAVMTHHGSFADIDQTYADLGTYVTAHDLGAPGPIREYYTADDLTDVCWPVARIPN